ncbi:MAG: prolyl oligopeptidase [Clostridiales bacterium]|nr:prolyl oligopeptidase [Clostridiales bacterium]MDN5282207.1 prolyl oligopeptidase [Candidatus Ozemobacter sp.]
MKKRYQYPESPVKTVTEKIYDYENVDHFRWLEGDENGETTDEVARWTDAQNNFTREILDNLPGRAELEKRITPLLQIESFSIPVMAGNRIFYSKREGSENQPVNYYVDQKDGVERVLINPNQLDETGLTAISWIAPTRDGRLVAYGKYKSGDENSQLFIINPETGEHLPETISGKVGMVFWLPDSSGFIYSRLSDLKNPYSRQICFHRPGQNPESDAIIFEQYKDGPMATTWGPFATLSDDGKWFILGYHTGTRSNDLWIADFNRWLKTGKLELKEIATDISATFHGTINDDKLYIYTNHEAPNGKILVADPNNPALEQARVFIDHKNDSVIENYGFTADSLLIEYQRNASSQVIQFNKGGEKVKEIKLPDIGTAEISTDPEKHEYYLGFTSFNRPRMVFHCDDRNNDQQMWKQTQLDLSLDDIEVTQEWFFSEDQTKVSMFLVHKKNLEYNQQNPTLIYGYGGFAIGMTPAFSPLLCPWLEDGGVYALVNLRGGNEYGDSWHSDGMLDKKKNVFADLEAAAQCLIDKKITCSDKLAVMGRSNGGLLTGAALTRRPDLYKAVVCGVPLLDMLRYQKFLMARFWVPEYGTAENQEHLQWLIEYSPYQNIKEGVDYPATFIYSGENDTRVHPMHARKMAAALQNFSGSADTKPILLWIDRNSGHGQGKPLNIKVLEETDQWLFLRWQTGMSATK